MIFTQGHCYAATEAAYHFFAKAAGFVPYVAKNEDGSTHWWLDHPETGQIIEPTFPQLREDAFIYKKGKRKGFQNPTPSKRARIIMLRMEENGK